MVKVTATFSCSRTEYRITAEMLVGIMSGTFDFVFTAESLQLFASLIS